MHRGGLLVCRAASVRVGCRWLSTEMRRTIGNSRKDQQERKHHDFRQTSHSTTNIPSSCLEVIFLAQNAYVVAGRIRSGECRREPTTHSLRHDKHRWLYSKILTRFVVCQDCSSQWLIWSPWLTLISFRARLTSPLQFARDFSFSTRNHIELQPLSRLSHPLLSLTLTAAV
jgi:hypothetical protein